MRVLVTGASGFLGQSFLRLLCREGHHAIVLARSEPRSPGTADRILGDVASGEVWGRIPRSVDCVVHLAAQTCGDTSSVDVRQDAVRVNVLGTWRALEFAASSAKRFVFASSMSVYGFPQKVPVHEMDVVAPASFYGATKAAAESLVPRCVTPPLQLPAVCLRFSSIYGPGQKAGVARVFFRQAGCQQPLTITNGGRDTSDFLYIEDAARALYLATVSDATGIVNIGSGEETSIRGLADAIGKAAPNDVDIRTEPGKREARRFAMSIKLAGRQLGYCPHYDVVRGMEAWFQAQDSFEPGR